MLKSDSLIFGFIVNSNVCTGLILNSLNESSSGNICTVDEYVIKNTRNINYFFM